MERIWTESALGLRPFAQSVMLRFVLVQVFTAVSLSSDRKHPPLTPARSLCLQNRQGKTRLSKFYVPYEEDEKSRIRGEVHRLIAPRDQKYQSNFVEVPNTLI